MKQFRLLADYQGLKAGDLVSGEMEDLPPLGLHLLTNSNGLEVSIPARFLEPVESNNKIFIVVVVVLIVGFVLYKIFKK
jgi:hypothetical protein